MLNYSKKIVFIFSILFVSLGGQIFSQDNFIRLIVPSADTTEIPQLRQRFNGSTKPGSLLTMNDSVINVYPSGAFAAFPVYKAGINKVDLVSVHPKYGTAKKTIWIRCTLPSSEKSTTGFNIEYVRILPEQDQCLVTGDVIAIRVKAQPGNTVKVFGKNLIELPQNLTAGVAGIYQGQYLLSPADTFELSKVEAEMTNQQGGIVKAKSSSLLSANGKEYNRYAITTGKMPALFMGLGTDRLGGAKFGYIDTSVLIKVTGRIGEMCRVKLAGETIAWINKSNITLLPSAYVPPSQPISSSFSVSGKDNFDYVKISLPERLPYTSNIEINPNRIELDVYGLSSNTNWITQLKSATEVKNIYYRQISSDVLRLIVELNHKQCWGYAVYYENNRLVLKIKHQPAKLKLSQLCIALDAGHGGSDNGAIGSTGLLEKDVNLLMVMKLKQALEKKGVKVILTRPDDSLRNNTDKWLALIPRNPDILLSIHNNSIGNSDPMLVKGTSTYYKYIGFRPLSVYLYDELLHCGLSEFGNIGSFNFTLNSPTEFINTLLELAFMSNPEDEMKLMDSKFQDMLVENIVKGLETFLKEAGK
jgi:N-acetylmuramoyl-L-alanine amidase